MREACLPAWAASCATTLRRAAPPPPAPPHVASIQAQLAVLAVSPSVGGNNGEVTLTISGTSLRSGSTVKLSHIGYTGIPGTGVVSSADASSLTASFDLTGAVTGPWDITVI